MTRNRNGDGTMTPKKLVVALALLLSAIVPTLALNYHRPGPFFGNDYGPDKAAVVPSLNGLTDLNRRT
jgi:hypothetical protein